MDPNRNQHETTTDNSFFFLWPSASKPFNHSPIFQPPNPYARMLHELQESTREAWRKHRGFPSCFQNAWDFDAHGSHAAPNQQVYGMKPTEWGNIWTLKLLVPIVPNLPTCDSSISRCAFRSSWSQRFKTWEDMAWATWSDLERLGWTGPMATRVMNMWYISHTVSIRSKYMYTVCVYHCNSLCISLSLHVILQTRTRTPTFISVCVETVRDIFICIQAGHNM